MRLLHDQIYGTGKGRRFLRGAYLTDLPRAVRERIRDEVEKRIALESTDDALAGYAYAPPPTRIGPQASQYVIDGLPLGGRVRFDSPAYRDYQCDPSDQFDGFTWCHKTGRERERRGSFDVSYTILHSRDRSAFYINRSQEPAFWGPNEVNEDIDRYSHKIGERPRIISMPRRQGLPNGIIALWGNAVLEPLDSASLKIVAEGQSPKKGILIDFIGNFARSVREGMPVYRVSGGAGFVWVASYDQNGRGTLRFSAVDASGFMPRVARTPVPTPSTPGNDGKTPAPRRPAEQVVSSGSGFFVSTEGHVLTNNHVVEDCSTVTIERPGLGATNATIIARDKSNDLALLRSAGKPTVVPAFRTRLKLGESISVFGFPLVGILSSMGNFTAGTVSALTGLDDDSRLVQISASVYPGNSGGPLIDKYGNVGGVIVGRIDTLQNVNFAIKSSIAVNFLSSNRLIPKDGATSRELPSEEIADLANSFTVRVLCTASTPATAGDRARTK
jgi:S1-C subfamily serine protease